MKAELKDCGLNFSYIDSRSAEAAKRIIQYGDSPQISNRNNVKHHHFKISEFTMNQIRLIHKIALTADANMQEAIFIALTKQCKKRNNNKCRNKYTLKSCQKQERDRKCLHNCHAACYIYTGVRFLAPRFVPFQNKLAYFPLPVTLKWGLMFQRPHR